MSFLIESYPLAINGTMGAMGLTAAERKAQNEAKRQANQNARAVAQQERKAAQDAAKMQRQQQASQNQIAAQARRDEARAAQIQRQQAAQVQKNLRNQEAEKRKVIAQVQAEIRQIDATARSQQLPPEWVAYRACLEEKLKDIARVCAKPGTTLQDVRKAAAKAKQESAKTARAAAQDLRKKAAEDRKKSAAQKKAEKQKKDQETAKAIAPALKNQLTALSRLAAELRAIKKLPANQRRGAADAVLKKYPSDILNTDSSAGLRGYGLGALGACRTVFIPGFGWREICDRPPKEWTPPPKVVGGDIFPPTGPVTAMPDSATYWDQRFEGRIGTKNDLTKFAFPACKNKAYKKFPIEQALCWSSLWEDTPDSLKKYFPKSVIKTYQLSGMGAIDPITGQEIPDTVDPTLMYTDPYATGGNIPVSSLMPTMPTVPLPKGGCEGKKASKPICMFYTLAAESQQMLYTVIQQIIALQNEILMVLNEIRSGAGAPVVGGGYCDPASGLWINADGTTGGPCSAAPVQDPYTNYPPVDPNYGYPPYDPGYGYPQPVTTAPYDGGMDFGGDMGVPADVYPGAPTTPYGYNQPYNPYQQIPDTMQLPADSAGGDIFSDGGVNFVPDDVPFNQYANQNFYPTGAPVMDFQNIPGGAMVADDIFSAEGGGGYIPGDISIYGAPSTNYQQAAPSLFASDQMFVMPSYAQTEMDAPLVVVEQGSEPFSQLMLPEDPAAKAAQFARQQSTNPYDQNSILASSFEGGGEEDFF